MKKRVFLIIVIFLISIATASAAYIDPNINSKFLEKDEISVIVILNDEPIQDIKDNELKIQEFKNTKSKEGKKSRGIAEKKLNQKKDMIDKVQKRFLSNFNNTNTNKKGRFDTASTDKKKKFKLDKKYSTINALSGKVTKEGLEELRNNPDVASVFIDKEYYVNLDQSIPQINADDVWALQLNAMNITGTGETVCIVDTGVDYTHNALGGCTITRLDLNGINESYVNESAHNYTNNFDFTWNITKPGYTSIAVHFKNISTESNYDYVYVYNSEMELIATYDGDFENIWSPHSEGESIYIRLDTDAAVVDYGFYIDYIINGTTNTTYNWSGCSKVIGGWDVVNSDGDPKDDHSHGTHVAGIIASDNETYRGIAPDTKIAAVKVLNAAGSGQSSDIIAGIDWCINNSHRLNISVISMSLGDCSMHQTYCNSDPLASSINSAASQGIVVAVAAGNCNTGQCPGITCTNGITSPACVQSALPVGGVNGADSIVYQRGTILDILSPGVGIRSTILSNGWGDKSGTSMSTPHVAGIVALMKQFVKLQNGTDISPQIIEDSLSNTGVQIYDSGTSKNYSRVDVFSAIISLDSKAPSINFTSPTPKDNEVLQRDWVFINISADEIISSALLEWNNVNESMSGSGMNFYINKTSLTEGEYTYKVYVNDSANNFNATQTRTVTIDTLSPKFSNPSNTSNEWRIGTNFTANIVINDSFLAYFIFSTNASGQWQNLTAQDINGNASYNASSSYEINITRNKSVCWYYWANDTAGNSNSSSYYCFNVENSAPTVSSIAITPFTPIRTDDLNCTYDASDADDDSLTAVFEWYNEGLAQGINSQILSAGNTSDDENWTCSTNVTDGIVYVFNTSESKSINDSTPPSITITTPQNQSTINNSYNIVLNITTDEISTCQYSLNGNYTNLGTDTSFTTFFSVYANTNYNLTVNCTDESSNTQTKVNQFTLSDTNFPSITSSGPTGSSTDTTPTLTLNTNEPSICYFTTDSEETNITNMTEFASTNSTTSTHSLSLSVGFYTYYTKCKDRLNNEMNTTESISFTITTPSSGGGGGGGSRGCSDECEQGQTGCSGTSSRAVCEYYTAGGCWQWSNYACGENEECIGDSCQEKVCVEEWICDVWSRCTNNTKSRVCEDWNSCQTEVYKPRTKEACETISPTIESPAEIVPPETPGTEVGEATEKNGNVWKWDGTKWVMKGKPTYQIMGTQSAEGEMETEESAGFGKIPLWLKITPIAIIASLLIIILTKNKGKKLAISFIKKYKERKNWHYIEKGFKKF